MTLLENEQISRRARLTMMTTLGVTVAVLSAAGELLNSTPPAYAAVCQPARGACGGIDVTRTSALDVVHVYDPTSTNQAVEPADSEDWEITAYWHEAGLGDCTTHSETASATVSWSSASDSWVISNESLTANIEDISICALGGYSCGNLSDTHSYAYRLTVDITDPVTIVRTYNLHKVDYLTSSVDDGQLIDLGLCSLGSTVSPVSQSWAASDTGSGAGGFECAFNCTAVGASVTIEYE